MKKFILDELVKPLIGRLGTAAGVWMVTTLDVDATTAQQIETGLVALTLVLWDLITRHALASKR